MKQRPFLAPARAFLAPALLSFVVLLSVNGFSQKALPSKNAHYGNYPADSSEPKKPWSWNLLFAPGTNKAAREKAVQKLESRVQASFNTLRAEFPGKYRRHLIFHVFFCPCDTLLYTMNTDVRLSGSGKVASQPPSPPKPPDGQGGGVDKIDFNYATIDKEANIKEKPDNDAYKKNYIAVLPAKPTVDDSRILAIMDTGLDPTMFPTGIKKLIWQDAKAPTLYNFLPGKPVGKFFDDHPEKHGSAVAGMALGEIKNAKVYPALMIMKVLDETKTGSSFSVSCALSYAYQHHAQVINMSLGYYSNGRPDSILNFYIRRCVHANPNPITIFAAAGNIISNHDQKLLCTKPGIQNLLTTGHLFYPACLNVAYPHLISVTGVEDNLHFSCLYQNFSETYVTVGLVRKDPGLCCMYKFPYKVKYYEGTSFATPVVAGMVMNAMIAGPPGTGALTALASLMRPAITLKGVTVNGNYIPY